MSDMELHGCAVMYPNKSAVSGYGEAVQTCDEDKDGRLWVGNGEYGSQVNYCPWCGFKARTPCPPEMRPA